MKRLAKRRWLFSLIVGWSFVTFAPSTVLGISADLPPDKSTTAGRPLLRQLEYTVKGRLLYEVLGLRPGKKQEYEFIVSVSNRLWAVEMRPIGELTMESGRLTQKTWSDGRVIIHSIHRPHPVDGFDAQVAAETSDVPLFSSSTFAQHIWLAYASQNYFDSVTNNRLKPVGYLEREAVRAGFTTPAKWRRASEFGLPLSIRYDFDGTSWFKAYKQSVPVRWTNAPNNASRLWTTYETHGLTNVSTTVLPGRFSVTSYEPLYEFQHDHELVVMRTSGKTESVSSKSDSELLNPQFNGRASVTDWRSGKFITYAIQDAAVPDLPERSN